MGNNNSVSNEKYADIDINKLVPFRNYPMDRFHGYRLTEVISEIEYNIENNIPLEPIDVRPLDDGKYEILIMHYYVAAAIKLGMKTIPAVIHDNLNDDEALSLLSHIEPVGLLYGINIDIFSPDFIESEEYKQIKDMKVNLDNGDVMALDEYIERFLLTDEEACKLYESKYCMGNPYQLSEDECSLESVAHEALYITTYKKFIDEENSKDTPPNSDYMETLKKNNSAEAEELVKNIITKKNTGYFYQIRKYLNIDLEKFNYDNLQNKRDRAKMIFFVYMMRKQYFPNFNFLKFLSKPSMENRSYFLPEYAKDRIDYFSFINHKIEKEISYEKKCEIRRTVFKIVDDWGELAYYGYDFICKKQSPLNQLQKILGLMKTCIEDPPQVGIVKELTPMNLLYLRLVQYQQLGMVFDNLKVMEMMESYECEDPKRYHEELERFVYERKYMEDPNKFFGTENIQKIAKYVYLREVVSREERRVLRESKEKIERFLGFYTLPGIYDIRQNKDFDPSDLLIISCLQCIIHDKRDEVFDYTYPGYEGTSQYRKGKQRVQGVLKNDDYTCYALRIFWASKARYRMHVNTEDGEYYKVMSGFTKICFSILKQLLTCSSTSKMEKMSEIYSERLKSLLRLL